MYEYRQLTPQQQYQIVQERIKKQMPSHRPGHLNASDRYYMISATCFEHYPYLNTATYRQQLLNLLFSSFEKDLIQIYAWVVLTNHYHVLVYLPPKQSFSKSMQIIHGGLSYTWNREEKQPGRKIWYQYTDTLIRSESHFYTVLNYIHYNPVKHKLVNSPYDWLESSVHLYLAEKGRSWLRDIWCRHPILDYGKDWDD